MTATPRRRRGHAGPRHGAVILLAIAVLGTLLVACSDDGSGSETAATSTTVVDATVMGGADPIAPDESVPDGDSVAWVEAGHGRRRLVGFGQRLVTITTPEGESCELCVMVAETRDQQRRGLMFVTDRELGGHDGLLFVNESPVTSGFWMRNTRIPLTAAFFDRHHEMIETVDMEPCPDDVPDAGCPRHGTSVPFAMALEIAARTPDELLLVSGARIELSAEACPEVLAGRPIA